MPPGASPPREDGELSPVITDVLLITAGNVEGEVLGRSEVLSGVEDNNGVEGKQAGAMDVEEKESQSVMEEKTEGKKQMVIEDDVNKTKASTESWVSVVQNNVVEKKVELDVEEIDGMPTARIPNSILEEAQTLWDDFLVGKFLAKAPFVGGIHALVNKI